MNRHCPTPNRKPQYQRGHRQSGIAKRHSGSVSLSSRRRPHQPVRAGGCGRRHSHDFPCQCKRRHCGRPAAYVDRHGLPSIPGAPSAPDTRQTPESLGRSPDLNRDVRDHHHGAQAPLRPWAWRACRPPFSSRRHTHLSARWHTDSRSLPACPRAAFQQGWRGRGRPRCGAANESPGTSCEGRPARQPCSRESTGFRTVPASRRPGAARVPPIYESSLR